MRKIYLFYILLYFTISLPAQTQPFFVQEEMRGVWLGTAFNNDWPFQPGSSSDEQKRQLLVYFNLFQKLRLNTVFVQVRPVGDAIYPSKTEMWSKSLSGTLGKPPHPYYDPLAYMIKLAKERNMELHAWFNPFRSLSQNRWDNTDYFHEHYKVFKEHPNWFVDYGNRKYFNPGIPEARRYIISVIMEVVRNYDIDGVHFDDYFYPYPKKGEPVFGDIKTFYKYNNHQFKNIKDWRRHNINEFIRELHDSVMAYNPMLKIGVAPPAVWRNSNFDPQGSKTLGLSSYDDLFADTRKWLQEGWIDYLVPQMYAEIGNKWGDFKTLAGWWNKNAYDKHIYAGIGIYRLDPHSKYNAWRSVSEIKKQMEIIKQTEAFRGAVFFSARTLLKNPLNIRELLIKDFYTLPAEPPAMWWKSRELILNDSTAIAIDLQGKEHSLSHNLQYIKLPVVTNIQYMRKKGELFLFWNWKSNYKCNKDVVFTIYRFKKNELPIADSNHLVATTYNKEISFSIRKRIFKHKYYYLIKAQCGVFKSAASEPVLIKH